MTAPLPAPAEVLQRVVELERQLKDLRRQLSTEAPCEQLPGSSFDVLAARAGTDEVGFVLGQVELVIRSAWLTRLPEAPPWVLGLLDLHGDQVPVLDLAARIRSAGAGSAGTGGAGTKSGGGIAPSQIVPSQIAPPRQPGLDELIVICRDAGHLVGFVVQEVRGSSRLEPAQVQRPSTQVAHARFVLGVARVDGRTSLLLSVGRLLEDAGLALPTPTDPEPAAGPPLGGVPQ